MHKINFTINIINILIITQLLEDTDSNYETNIHQDFPELNLQF